MARTLQITVSSHDGIRIGVDGVNNLPYVNLALNLKIPIHELVSALADFQKPVEAAEPPGLLNKPEPKHAAPPPQHAAGVEGPATAAGGGGAAPQGAVAGSRPQFPPQGAWAPHKVPQPSSEQAGGGPVPPAPGLAPAQSPERLHGGTPQKPSWEGSSIADLQSSHKEYVERTKWTAAGAMKWLLTNEKPLMGFKPKPLDPPRLLRAPYGECQAAPAAAAPPPPPPKALPASLPPPPKAQAARAVVPPTPDGSFAGPPTTTDASFPEALLVTAFAAGDRVAAEGSQVPDRPEDDFAEEYPPPPMHPPPPPVAGMPSEGPPAQPPPGLPIPEGAMGGTPQGLEHELPPGLQGGNNQKECKQQ
mmetsp:Transcript_124559/g.387854  ORF Transcript_124559/g.387854 Transcript_124559/m.387854 type:complete len:361 (+) Transcript_124559:110-1192(+)